MSLTARILLAASFASPLLEPLNCLPFFVHLWGVDSGTGKTVVDGMEQSVQAGDVLTMSAGCRHTIMADTELKLIEVQLGKDISVQDKQKFELEY